MADDQDWAAAFADAFARTTPVEQRVYASVLGDAHPNELNTYSCLTWAELHRMADWLSPGRNQLLVDLGCGRAGPGVWTAARAGARLVGIDVTDAPFEQAAAAADRAGVDADFRIGSLTDTGLDSDSVDAVLSVDALQFATDPVQALTEIRRILRPDGRLALTAAEHVDDLDDARRQPSATAAHARDAGLLVAACDTPPEWGATARRIADEMRAATDGIATEMGADPAEVREALERVAAHRLQERRILLLARRPRGQPRTQT